MNDLLLPTEYLIVIVTFPHNKNSTNKGFPTIE